MPTNVLPLDEYLNDHLPYEQMMLKYTFERVSSGELRQLEWNAHFESFSVHARNLYQFLTNGDADIKAHHYVPAGFRSSKTSETIRTFEQLNRQVHHLSAKRTGDSAAKVQLDHARSAYDWLTENLEQFLNALSTERALTWTTARIAMLDVSGLPGTLGPSHTGATAISSTSPLPALRAQRASRFKPTRSCPAGPVSASR